LLTDWPDERDLGVNPESPVHIRQANELDITAITRIYNDLIHHGPTTAQLDPVSLENRREWFQAPDRSRYPVFVAENQGSILGYLSLNPYRSGRRALDATAEVSYFVDPRYHHQGIGIKLLKQALEHCPSHQIDTLLAILLDTNEASRGLLEKFGFRRWGHLPGVAEINGQRLGQYYYGLTLNP
jgi:L-amino acid N-acyltransferase YncA